LLRLALSRSQWPKLAIQPFRRGLHPLIVIAFFAIENRPH
jgi:hypothetical protein